MSTLICRSCNSSLNDDNHKQYYGRQCRECYSAKKRAERKRRYQTDVQFREKEQERALARHVDPSVIASHLDNPCINCQVMLTYDNHKDYNGPRCKDCYKKMKRDRKREKYQSDPEFKAKCQSLNRDYHKDPEKRIQINERRKDHYANDPIFRLRINLSNRINDALKSESKSDDTENLIGIPFAQFKNWIEFQFDTDMTWENHGGYWEIDHVKPCASFNLTSEAEQKVCFAWSNQRPTLVKENREKEDKIIPELIAQHSKLVNTYAKLHSLKIIH